MNGMEPATKTADRGHHERHCRICNSPQRSAIEQSYLDWSPVTEITRTFKVTRAQVYRHTRAVGLFKRRNEHVAAALGGFIERGLCIRPTGQSFVAACVALSKLNAAGKTVERFEGVDSLDDIIRSMTIGELKKYVQDGTLPDRFSKDAPGT